MVFLVERKTPKILRKKILFLSLMINKVRCNERSKISIPKQTVNLENTLCDNYISVECVAVKSRIGVAVKDAAMHQMNYGVN